MNRCHYCNDNLDHRREAYAFDGHLFCDRQCALRYLLAASTVRVAGIVPASINLHSANVVLNACGEEVRMEDIT